MMSQAYKNEWQRKQRAEFQKKHGYSTASHYATGKLREAVLVRDGRKCVGCGMTEQQHLAKWGRPITIDHKDKNRKRNVMSNLQTMCLSCHGRKDLSPKLRVQQVSRFKAAIVSRRRDGATYQAIADEFGFGITAIWKWCKKWNTR